MRDGVAGGLENVDIYTHENLAEVLMQRFDDHSNSKTHGDAYFEWLASFGLVQGCRQHTTWCAHPRSALMTAGMATHLTRWQDSAQSQRMLNYITVSSSKLRKCQMMVLP